MTAAHCLDWAGPSTHLPCSVAIAQIPLWPVRPCIHVTIVLQIAGTLTHKKTLQCILPKLLSVVAARDDLLDHLSASRFIVTHTGLILTSSHNSQQTQGW